MRILYLTDRVSRLGGADHHLLQVVGCAVRAGAATTIAYGRRDGEVELPSGATGVRIKGVAKAVESTARLGDLASLLDGADVIHVQNVMNPVVLRMAAATGRAVVTVQDHRVFCPGPGKTLPEGAPCRERMSDALCARCLPDAIYRSRALALTEARAEALASARLLVLSRYMASELEAIGLGGAEVVPPWIEVSPRRQAPGDGFVLGGRLVSHKGVVTAWESWKHAGAPQALRVAGEGPLAEELPGAERLGWLETTELRRLLRASRALLFPSRWQEPFGILGVEALAEGTPVVVAESGGSADWSGAGCLRVPSDDAEAMAAAIRLLADDPALAMGLGDSGRVAVEQLFARHAIESRLLALYGEVAGGSPRPSSLDPVALPPDER